MPPTLCGKKRQLSLTIDRNPISMYIFRCCFSLLNKVSFFSTAAVGFSHTPVACPGALKKDGLHASVDLPGEGVIMGNLKKNATASHPHLQMYNGQTDRNYGVCRQPS
jgi:hypothetical protein